MDKTDLKKYLYGILLGFSIAGCATSYFSSDEPVSYEKSIDDEDLESFKEKFVANLDKNDEIEDEVDEIKELFINEASFFDKYAKYINRKEILKRIKELKINYIKEKEEDEEFLERENLAGYYSPKDLSITVLDNEVNPSNTILGHEMIHFFSMGGYNRTKELSVLNESVTEMLTVSLEKYEFMRCSYTKDFKAVIPLIEVIGKDKILETYFNKDETELCNYIGQYTNKTDELFKSLTRITLLDEEYDNEQTTKEQKEIIKNKRIEEYETYFKILSEVYKNKYNKNMYENDFYNMYMYKCGVRNIMFSNKLIDSQKDEITNVSYNPFSDTYKDGLASTSFYHDSDIQQSILGDSIINGTAYGYLLDEQGNWYDEDTKELIDTSSFSFKR